MHAREEFHAGYGTVAILGQYDKKEHTFTREQVLSLLHWDDDAVRKETERHFIRWKLQPITYIYNYNLFERLLTADRAGELKLSAKKFLALSDEEYKQKVIKYVNKMIKI